MKRTPDGEVSAVMKSDSTGLPARPGWQVYIILCSDSSLYTGITTDIERRFRQHTTGQGAKYFRGRQPLRVVYREDNHSRSSAARRELQIKALSRADKLLLLAQPLPPTLTCRTQTDPPLS